MGSGLIRSFLVTYKTIHGSCIESSWNFLCGGGRCEPCLPKLHMYSSVEIGGLIF